MTKNRPGGPAFLAVGLVKSETGLRRGVGESTAVASVNTLEDSRAGEAERSSGDMPFLKPSWEGIGDAERTAS